MTAAATTSSPDRRRWFIASLSVALLGPATPPARADDVLVIINKDNPNAVNAEFVTRVYTGALKGWPDGNAVMVFDQSDETEVRELFCASVLRRSLANVKAIWSQNIFTGKGMPPKVAAPDAAMKRAVASNRYAIGYIRASQLDDTVKVAARWSP
jgi:ABC-type phosphate transport system substrate-binding protein